MPKSVKEDLLRVAGSHFYRYGYDATSVKEIVEECKTTAPALYHHYGSKEKLAVAYLEHAAHELTGRWKPVMSKATLPEIIEAWVQRIRSDIYPGGDGPANILVLLG